MSTNTNSVTVEQHCTGSAETETGVTTTVDVTASTGGNKASGNTDGGLVTTGDASIDLSVTNQ